MTVYLEAPDGVIARVGEHLGYSDYIEVTQERINLFAAATGDDQWIHCDPERAAGGPFGAAIAQGYLVLAISAAVPFVFRITGAKMAVNYGVNKVRFPSPVKAGSRLRYGVKLLSAELVQPKVLQVTFEAVYEVEGAEKPACIAEQVGRYFL